LADTSTLGDQDVSSDNDQGDNMNARRIGTVVGALAAAVAFAANTGPAAATAPDPAASFAGHLVAGPGATTVKINYTCSATDGPINHLFVAVKQGPLVDTEEHSSSDSADTFYSTNWKSDAGPNALRCNGVNHTQTIVLKPQPGFEPAVPRLHAGPALVQICVFDNVTGFTKDGDFIGGGSRFDYPMQQVHAGKGQG
jgi:hypothetical protein